MTDFVVVILAVIVIGSIVGSAGVIASILVIVLSAAVGFARVSRGEFLLLLTLLPLARAGRTILNAAAAAACVGTDMDVTRSPSRILLLSAIASPGAPIPTIITASATATTPLTTAAIGVVVIIVIVAVVVRSVSCSREVAAGGYPVHRCASINHTQHLVSRVIHSHCTR